MESMGLVSGCGCKEVYRFPHTTYPYSSCICSFLQQHPYFLFIFLLHRCSGTVGNLTVYIFFRLVQNAVL